MVPMFRRRTFLRLLAALAAAAVIVVMLTPALVVGGVRTWLWWTARSHDLTIDCRNVDAPLLRPVVLEDLRVRTRGGSPGGPEMDVPRAELRFNLRTLFGNSPGRLLRELSVEGARVVLRENAAQKSSEESGAHWALLDNLLADSFKFANTDLLVENGSTRVQLRGLSFAASELESGSFAVGEVAVASPLVTRTFTHLRGAASWQNDRLTFGALSLTPGIDLDGVTADLSRLAARRIDVAIMLDAFGGKLRADLTSDDRPTGRVWTVAGSASGIALVQMSDLLGWSERATGLVRASKFTYRGTAESIARSTISVWLELVDLTWRDRSANTIMVGASLHNGQIHVDQVYVKQRENQFTLGGDSALAGDGTLWPLRDFTGYLSATIPDLDAFARLFGAERNTFSGDIALEAAVGLANRQFRAVDLSASGEVHINDARLGEALRASAHLVADGSTAVVQSARIEQDGGAIELHGNLDFADLSVLRATLVPAVPLVNMTPPAGEGCINQLSISAAPPEEPQVPVTQVEIRGGLFTRDWRLSVRREPAAANDSEQESTPAAETHALCFGASDAARELRIGIPPPPDPPPPQE